ncbi:UAP56-interacting factor [Protopterus annectens]|uniref:UAP56-interacting factor n=1 Tax=Protopterus annectens TaxID=7888 RepID=UPI001CFB6C33|nr:UAP56-interacting factor [Protopterus annectens]
MSGFGLSSARENGGRRTSDNVVDKLNMSLDEIIKLNRRERLKNRAVFKRGRSRMNQGRQQKRFLSFGRRGALRRIQQQRGGVKRRLGLMGIKTTVRRRVRGVITGLAAKRSGVARNLNRSSLNQKNLQRFRPVFQRQLQNQGPAEGARWQTVTLTRSLDSKRSITIIRTPRKAVVTRTAASQQKAARQAVFLFRRGLKVQAQVQPSQGMKNSEIRHWRTSITNGGILTVSINNPEARMLPVTQIQRPRLTRPLFAPLLIKKDGEPEEKKIPKGVPLQFDINSLWKQTGMTLNERFKILKEQRTATTQSRGIRLVTVGQNF